jgi:hypothetical protein
MKYRLGFSKLPVYLSFLFVAIFAVAPFCLGQENAKLSVRGQVVDQNGAAIAGARVSINSANKNVSALTVSNATGGFEFEVNPGDYVIQVEARGFNSFSKPVQISTDGNGEIELKLVVETAVATVNVTDGGDHQIGTISSATKTFTALRDIPQSVSITTKEQIADQSMSSIGEVVRYQPGITAHQGENNRDQIIIRGQSSSADFFANGVRDDVQYYRDLYNLNRIEILRGPNALAFGRGGGGGLINRVTKEAGFSPAYEFTLQGGAFGDRRTIH